MKFGTYSHNVSIVIFLIVISLNLIFNSLVILIFIFMTIIPAD